MGLIPTKEFTNQFFSQLQDEVNNFYLGFVFGPSQQILNEWKQKQKKIRFLLDETTSIILSRQYSFISNYAFGTTDLFFQRLIYSQLHRWPLNGDIPLSESSLCAWDDTSRQSLENGRTSWKSHTLLHMHNWIGLGFIFWSSWCVTVPVQSHPISFKHWGKLRACLVQSLNKILLTEGPDLWGSLKNKTIK